MRNLRRNGGRWRLLLGLAALAGLSSRPALGQVPGLAAAAAGKGQAATHGGSTADGEKAKPAVATSTGPITVREQVKDTEI
jgi:hypothetical protein